MKGDIMIQYCCDRCGNVFDITDIECDYDIVNHKQNISLDLCKDCYGDLVKWINLKYLKLDLGFVAGPS